MLASTMYSYPEHCEEVRLGFLLAHTHAHTHTHTHTHESYNARATKEQWSPLVVDTIFTTDWLLWAQPLRGQH